MVREGQHKYVDFSTRDFIDQFAVRPSEIGGLTAGGVIDNEYSTVAGKIHGLNHPGGPWCNVYSNAIQPAEHQIIGIATAIPDNLLPRPTDTPDSLRERLANSTFFDVLLFTRSGQLHQHSPTSKQCFRRHMAALTALPHVYTGRDGEGSNRSVITSYSYPLRQVQPDSERSRPLRELHQMFMCIVWKHVYGYLTKVSQDRPPNGMHCLCYYTMLQHSMDKHKDNCTPEELESIVNGEFESSAPRPIRGTYASQIPGSSVIIFSRGNRPMTFKLWYTSRKNKTAARHVTKSDIRCQFSMGDGWVTVLDPIDDVLMYHSVSFEYNSKNDVEGYRIAWVMRWLSQTHDYFVDTCGLRRTQAMLSIYGQQMTCDSQFPETRRNILC